MRRAGLLVGASSLLAAFAVFLRARAHPLHVLDLEGTFVSIAGRQLAHGHGRDFFGYQIDWYRGEPLVDGVLAALGFLAFGDSLMAWLWVSLLWVVLGVACVGALLRRLDNPVGALLFGVLVAAGPLLLKDGLASNTVGHAATPVLALIALLPLVRAPSQGPADWRRGALAGALMGFAIWYQRTAVLGVPALLLAGSVHGRAVLGASVAGLLSFPVLVLVNAGLLLDVGGRRAEEGFAAVVAKCLVGVEGGSTGDRSPLEALRDPMGFGIQPLLNAEPRVGAPGALPRQGALTRLHGWLWPVAAVMGATAVAVSIGKRLRDPRWVLLALAVGWTLGYALTSFEAESTLFELAQQEPARAPSTSTTRYLIPSLLLWTAVVAQGLGQAWRHSAGRWVAGALGGLLVLGGAVTAASDLRPSPRAADAFASTLPFEYVGVYGHWVGPTRHLHTQCTSDDPTCRAHHLRALGAWGEPRLRVMESEPQGLALEEQLQVLADELDADERQRSFLAHGMGIDIARLSFSAPNGDVFVRRLQLLKGELGMMRAPDAEALSRGFAEHARVGSFMTDSATRIAALACPPGEPSPPLCPIVADAREPSTDVVQWIEGLDPWARELSAGDPQHHQAIRHAMLRGLGTRLGRIHPPSTWEELAQPLDGAERAALLAGIATGARSRWRTAPTEQTPPWEHP